MGILDSFNDPSTIGLLSAASGLLSASGPSRMPVSFGQALGSGIMSGMQGYQAAKKLADDDAMKQLQMLILLQKAKKEQQLQDYISNRFGFGNQSEGNLQQPFSGNGGLSQETPYGLNKQEAMPSANTGIQSSAASPFNGQQQGAMPSKLQNDSFPLTPNEIAALSVLGAPGTKDLFDIYKYVKDGIRRDAGAYYVNPMTGQTVYMPKVPEGATMTTDGRIVGIPGAIDFNAAYKGAETFAAERAKAGLDLVQVPMADGSTRMMPRDQAASILSGQAMTPRGASPFGPSQPAIGVSQSPGDKTYQDEAAKAAAAQYKQIQEAGFTAPNKIAKYQQLGALLENFDGNKLSPMGIEIARFAKLLRLNIDPKLPNKEAAMALTNELALALRNPSGGEGMPGNLSDADRQFLVNSVPNLQQSAQGRRQMIDMQIKLLQRQADTAAMARKWVQRYGRIDAVNPVTGKSFFDNLQEWADRNPLFVQPEQ
jgi:hypothetical protein